MDQLNKHEQSCTNYLKEIEGAKDAYDLYNAIENSGNFNREFRYFVQNAF